MPILVSYSHLLHNLLNIFVGGLHSAIHLWSIRRRIVMFDIELCTELSDHLIVQIGTIISDDSFGDAIPTDEVVFNESSYHVLGYGGERSSFYPFSEIVNGY